MRTAVSQGCHLGDDPLQTERPAGGERDAERFAALYERYQGAIYGYCYRQLRDIQQAEDVTQDTFMKAWAAWRRFDGRAPWAWLTRIAHNLMTDHFRRQQVIRFTPLDQPLFRSPKHLSEDGDNFLPISSRLAGTSDTEIEALRPLLLEEIQTQVATTMRKLPERYQRVLWMQAVAPDCHSMRWSAAEERITHGAAKSLTFRARRQFREEWAA